MGASQERTRQPKCRDELGRRRVIAWRIRKLPNVFLMIVEFCEIQGLILWHSGAFLGRLPAMLWLAESCGPKILQSKNRQTFRCQLCSVLALSRKRPGLTWLLRVRSWHQLPHSTIRVILETLNHPKDNSFPTQQQPLSSCSGPAQG